MLVRVTFAVAVGAIALSTAVAAVASPRDGARSAAPATAFSSPDGGIRCRYFPSASTIGCLAVTRNMETMMRASGKPYTQRVSHEFPRAATLAYGKSRTFGGEFKCTSRRDGILCQSLVTRRCFVAARAGSTFACSSGISGGTTSERNCHPSYTGACLDPTASDYDCAGGEGNGPEYVSGPIRVVGPDEFDLDRDGDGVACEPYP